jgi:hypothetical protein
MTDTLRFADLLKVARLGSAPRAKGTTVPAASPLARALLSTRRFGPAGRGFVTRCQFFMRNEGSS